MPKNQFYKQPREVLDYYVDMKDYFREYAGDTILDQNDIIVEIDPIGTLVNEAVVLNGDPATGFSIWLSGGTDGDKHKITFLINTKEGRVEEEEMQMRIKEL